MMLRKMANCIFQPLTREPLNLQLGEGAQLSPVDGKVYFLNIFVREEERAAGAKPGIYRFNPADLNHDGYLPLTKLEFYPVNGDAIGCIGFTDDSDVLVAGIDQSLKLINLKTGTEKILASAHSELIGARFNDGDTSPEGRYFVIGTKGRSIPGGVESTGNLYAYDTQTGAMNILLDNIQISNGLGWSPDAKTFYYIDTRIDRDDVPVYAFDYNPHAKKIISNQRTLFQVSGPGKPDGMKIDAHGNLHIAFFAGGHVRSFSPAGQEISRFEISQNAQTTIPVIFGNNMLVTTAAEGIAVDALPDPHWGTPYVARNIPAAFRGHSAYVLGKI